MLLAGSVFPAARGDDDFPYTAYVTSRQPAKVYSGPGYDFYTTDQLDAGMEVEVFRHLDNRWAAVRPPAGSFSLVPVSALHVSGNNDLGTVVAEVKTLVGSRLGHGRHEVEYVTLTQGEEVQILGSTELALEDGQDLMCYEIAPPAGEFRWMRLRDISRERKERTESPSADEHPLARFEEHNGVQQSSRAARLTGESWVAGEDSEVNKVQLTKFAADADEDASHDGLSSAGIPATQPDSAAQLSDPAASHRWNLSASSRNALDSDPPTPGNAAVSPNSTDELGLVAPPARSLDAAAGQPDRQSVSSAGGWRSPGVPAPAALPVIRSWSPQRHPLQLGPIGKLRLSQELIDIELQLTTQVCQPPGTWHLTDLRTRAQAVIDASNDPQQRAVAQHIIAKIAQFEDVRRRQKTLVSTNFDRNAPQPKLVSREAAGASIYDGTGFLMPVVTQDPGIPKYVLTDEDGNIVQFVSPKPGISLKRFEQQRVGILGERGYLPTYNQPHLMAERVITLEKTR